MPFSKSIHQYADVRQALEAARAAGGAIYRLDTPGQAKNWRHRTYYFRSLLAAKDEEAHGNIPGYIAGTEWDDMTLTIDPADPTGVRIEFGVVKGKLEGLGGDHIAQPLAPKPRKAEKPVAPIDADLLAAAESLAMEIDKG